MKPEQYSPQALLSLLRQRRIVSMDEMKEALRTDVDLTVIRKLKQLGYRSSYSHRGAWYTLDRIAEFDENGLWFFGPARFSVRGTLAATAEAFVSEAEAGFYAAELEALLRVGVKETMLRLVRGGRISREKLRRRYLYCSREAAVGRRQALARRAAESEPSCGALPAGEPHDELKAAVILFFCLLDERQRRLYAGLESMKWGRGGDRKVAELLDLDPATVAKGRRQLLNQDVETERVRQAGGGRKRTEKKRRKSSPGSKRS